MDPDPIQSYNKLAKIQQFNQYEAEREKLHRDDPLGTKLLHVSVVLVVIAIAFLIFFKLCWDREKYLRRNPQYDTGGGSRRASLSSTSHPTRVVGHATTANTDNEGVTTVNIIPDSQYYKPLSRKSDSGDGLKKWIGWGR